MAIIQPQLWDGYPLLGDDGYPVVDPACCCPAAPPPEDECTFCIPGTFNSTTAAVVYFTGSASNEGCDKCNEHMMRQEFELPRMDIPGGENKDPCTYYLGGALGCNVSGSGYDWMEFGWHFWTAGFFNGVLVLHYYCIDDEGYEKGGTHTWFTNKIPYIPDKYNCLTSPDFSPNLPPANHDEGWSPYMPCNMNGVNASVTFLTT